MLRRSFLPPIPEFGLAASLLAKAADALIANELHLCEKFIREADLRALREFSYLVTGPINPEIHRQSKNPVYDPIPKNKLPRMPNAEVTKNIFLRDGYRCRFCGSRVILKQAQKKFISLFPKAARWGRTNEDKHFGLSTITASIDHIIPYKRGGNNDKNNLVTACGPCQFGRNQWLLEEVEIEDPRNHAPIVDDWDGLARIIKYESQLKTN